VRLGSSNRIGRLNQMPRTTEQMVVWQGVFGKEYSNRNTLSPDEMDDLYRKNYGVSRTDLNKRFLDEMDHSIRILEVGCNVGNQLLCLQKMGFHNLYGIELQPYAVELSKSRTHYINIIQGTAFDIPFKDGFFDLVFTSGLLTHISPSDIHDAMHEIYRSTKKWIFGFEAHAERYVEVTYRKQQGLFWKVDYVKVYIELFKDLEISIEERMKYLDSQNEDTMFLLRKRRQLVRW
jgi:pseudaminic acid biosynthesis-associated methylase